MSGVWYGCGCEVRSGDEERNTGEELTTDTEARSIGLGCHEGAICAKKYKGRITIDGTEVTEKVIEKRMSRACGGWCGELVGGLCG